MYDEAGLRNGWPGIRADSYPAGTDQVACVSSDDVDLQMKADGFWAAQRNEGRMSYPYNGLTGSEKMRRLASMAKEAIEA